MPIQVLPNGQLELVSGKRKAKDHKHYSEPRDQRIAKLREQLTEIEEQNEKLRELKKEAVEDAQKWRQEAIFYKKELEETKDSYEDLLARFKRHREEIKQKDKVIQKRDDEIRQKDKETEGLEKLEVVRLRNVDEDRQLAETKTLKDENAQVKDMADFYVSHQQASSKLQSMLTGPQDGYGEGRIGEPMSPTRPHSMRRRQSMQVLDLEARVEQLAAENRMLVEAKELAERSLQSSQRGTLALADRDAEVDSLKQTLDWLQREVERLKEINDGLTSANITLGRQHNERYGALESQHADATRELNDLQQQHRELSGGMKGIVRTEVDLSSKRLQKEQRDKLEHIWTLLHRTL